MRLKALLIDDEINIIRNLQLVLPWEEHNVEIAGTAKNGVQALELVKEHHPHLIFCDIRMPVMDGIDFLRELRAFNQSAEVIMLTGYQEFEYARTVLRYRVLDYVLKPIDYDGLEVLFINVVRTIREHLQQLQLENEAQGRLKEMANEKILLDLLHGHTHDQGVMEWQEQFGMLEQQFILFAISGEHIAAQSVLEQELLQALAVLPAVDGRQQAYVMHVDDSFWTVIAAGRYEGVKQDQLLQTTHHISSLFSTLDHDVSVAVYEGVIKAEHLHVTWQRLSRELSLAQQPQIVVQQTTVSSEDDIDQQVWKCIEALIHSIKHLDRAAANEYVEQFQEQVRMYSTRSLHQVDKLINSVIVYMLKELRKYDAVPEKVEQYIWQQLGSSNKLKQMTELIKDMVEQAFKEHSNKRPQVSIHVAKEYIESHLSSDIAAEEVAHYLNISLSYFSTLFKQYYGMTFMEYVTGARIERAKGMLTLSKKSITDIAKAVGYTERRYFNKVFYKKVGMLPSEYRDLKTKESR